MSKEQQQAAAFRELQMPSGDAAFIESHRMAAGGTVSTDARDEMRIVRRGLGKVGKGNAIETHIKECAPELVAPALLLVALSKDLDVPYHGVDHTPFIDVLAADTGVDVKAIQAGVKQEMKAAAAARKKEAEADAAPAKPAAKKTPVKKKATAAEAKAAIAQALQQQPASANDFEVGQAVRFKQDLKGPTGQLRKVCGRAGTIETKHGDRGWMVRYGKNKHDVAGADYTELEHADTASDDQLATGAIELANGVKLDPQPAWPFPKDPKASGQPVTLETELAKAEASGNKYRLRGLRKRIAEQAAASTEPAPNAAAAAWPFPTAPKKARKGAMLSGDAGVLDGTNRTTNGTIGQP